jgi:methionyl-tRNA formyltransferase
MKIIFAGTPDFAARALEALLAAGHDVALALTQPDRPSGRGMALQASAVKKVALAHGIPVSQPERLKDPSTHEPVRAACEAGAELMVVAAYGLILPQAVLDLPRRGCINIHASLLPRWRGAAPIHRAIEAGDTRTGITIMRMEAGLDTGPMLLSRAIDIDPQDSTGHLHDRLARLGGELVVEALGRFDQLRPETQPEAGVTYASKIDKAEAKLDWNQPATTLARKLRAFDPFPGAVVTPGRRTGQGLARRGRGRYRSARASAGRRYWRDRCRLRRRRTAPHRTAEARGPPRRRRRLPQRQQASPGLMPAPLHIGLHADVASGLVVDGDHQVERQRADDGQPDTEWIAHQQRAADDQHVGRHLHLAGRPAAGVLQVDRHDAEAAEAGLVPDQDQQPYPRSGNRP